MGELVDNAYVDVALPLPLHKTFTYAVPPEFRNAIAPGIRVLVPFGTKSLTGVVVATALSSSVTGVRPLSDVLDIEPTSL